MINPVSNYEKKKQQQQQNNSSTWAESYRAIFNLLFFLLLGTFKLFWLLSNSRYPRVIHIQYVTGTLTARSSV